MKRNFSVMLTAIMILAVVTVVFFNQENDRQRYERFLMEEYAKMPDLPEADYKDLKKPDRPDLAAMQNYFMLADPATGTVPVDRLKQGYLVAERIRNESTLRLNTSTVQWTATDANMGGRTRAIMYDPIDESGNKVWAGSVTGGLWYNNDITDDDSQWIPVGDFWDNLAISSICYDPNDPQTFYVGTGEGETAVTIYRESSGVGMGILKSTDGGLSWDFLPSTSGWKYVTDVAVRDENGSSVIYAGVTSGIYHGIVQQSEPYDGLYRSVDGGISWEQVLPDMNGASDPYPVSDIEIASNGRIFVGTMQNPNLDGGGVILYSDDGTTGSWNVYDDQANYILGQSYYNIPGRVVLASAPSDPSRVYALFAVGYTDGFTYYRGLYILRTSDAGQSWMTLPLPDDEWATLAWHALTAGVDPNDPDHMYVGGLDVWKTSNGGMNWSHLSDWSLMYYGGGPDYVHADQHVSLFKPGSSDEVLYGSDGGVFYTSEGTSSNPDFEEKNRSYNSLQFYTCAISPVSGENRFIGGLQDNGTLYYDNAALDINDMVDGGDGAACFWDEDESQIFITSVYYNRYSIFVNGSYYNNAGDYSGTFISPADYDYKENILYANACSFFGSHADQLLRIKNIPNYPSEAYITLGTGNFVPFSHVKYSPYSPSGTSTLFVGTQSGRLYKVTNAQSSPIVDEITGSNFPIANISCVAIGANENELLVTFSNYGVTQIFQSLDGGQNWEVKQGNFPDIPVRWAIYHPENSEQALLATEIGVWSTNTLHLQNTVWEPAIDGLANVRTDMLQLRKSDNTVLAATHGRGFYTAEYPYDPYVGLNDLQEDEVVVYPNPSKGIFRIEFNSGKSEQIHLSLFDTEGKILFAQSLQGKNKDIRKDFNLRSFPAGLYILKISDGYEILNKKIILQ